MSRPQPQGQAPGALFLFLARVLLRGRAEGSQPFTNACLLRRSHKSRQWGKLQLGANPRAVYLSDLSEHIRIMLGQVGPNIGNGVVVLHALKQCRRKQRGATHAPSSGQRGAVR